MSVQVDLSASAFAVLLGAQKMFHLATEALDAANANARAAFQARIQAAGGHAAWMLLPGDVRSEAYEECRRAAGCRIASDMYCIAAETRSEASWLLVKACAAADQEPPAGVPSPV
jgi:hypothetical protein